MRRIPLVLLFLSLPACVAHAYVSTSAVVVASPPPQPIVVAPLVCPAGHIYVEGRYHWNGYAWVWIDHGCYYKPGYVWITPAYIVVGGGVKYHAGYWKPVSVQHKAKPMQPAKKHGALPAHPTGKPHPVVKAKPLDG